MLGSVPSPRGRHNRSRMGRGGIGPRSNCPAPLPASKMPLFATTKSTASFPTAFSIAAGQGETYERLANGPVTAPRRSGSSTSRPAGARMSTLETRTGALSTAGRKSPHDGMVWIPGGTFRMGSDRHYPEEAPAHEVRVDGFWMDAHTVTNEEFRRFVDATGHVTLAERPPDPA